MGNELEELRAGCQKLDMLVKNKGAKTEYCNARYEVAQAYKNLGYKDLAFAQTKLAKNELYRIVKQQTISISPNGQGFDLFQLEDYCRDRSIETNENRLFNDLLFLESHDIFDSYLLYLEKDRFTQDRFYLPRRACLRRTGVVQSLQDLEDDLLDILSISLPPGTGKASRLSANVLTPNGWVRMGNIKVGDKVIAGNGNVTTVLGVFPQGKKPCYRFTLTDGRKTECSGDHLWQVDRLTLDNHENITTKTEVLTTNYLRSRLSEEDFYIPVFDSENWKMGDYVALQSIEYIGEEECQCIYIEDDCHLYITDDYIITHNTTLENFFCSWIMGKYPEDYNLFFSHSGDITKMFYKEVLDVIKSSEYKFAEIFPNVTIQATDAKANKINLNAFKPFDSLQCTTSGSDNAGKVRANHYLFCDDLVPGIEVALNKTQLDKLWRIYGTDAKQRKLPRSIFENGIKVKDVACKEVHIATRWSVHDVIGRLQLSYKGSDRARFIAVPDIDPQTGKSNFEYDVNGMSVEFFNDIALTMDDISYRCLYKNDPIEREGLLYVADELKRYREEDYEGKEPDGVYCICDVKNKGTDFMVALVLAQYGKEYLCIDCVCDDNADFGVQKQKIASLLFKNRVQLAEFEANNGGDRFADDVDETLKEMGGFTNISSKFTETNKETRIIVNAPWVKTNVRFKEYDKYSPKEDYGIMMSWLCRYSTVGKNVHDDVPDCFANTALYFTRDQQKAEVKPIVNPLWGGNGYC